MTTRVGVLRNADRPRRGASPASRRSSTATPRSPARRPGRPPTCYAISTALAAGGVAAHGDPRLALARGLPRPRRRRRPATSTLAGSTASWQPSPSSGPRPLDRPFDCRGARMSFTPYADVPGRARRRAHRTRGSTPTAIYADIVARARRRTSPTAGRRPDQRGDHLRPTPAARPTSRPRAGRRRRPRRRRDRLPLRDGRRRRPITDRVARRHARREGRRRDARRRPDPRPAHRRAHRPQLRQPPLRRRDRDLALGRRARGHRRRVLDTRKTLPGLARAAEVRRPLRRRRQPPLSACQTWRWSRTTTSSPPGESCPRSRRCAPAYPGLPGRGRGDDLDQLDELLDARLPERILLDNMTDDADGRGRADHRRARRPLEAIAAGSPSSGAREVGETGVDFISVGALTHSVDRCSTSAWTSPSEDP